MLNDQYAESEGRRENERQTQQVELCSQPDPSLGDHHAMRLWKNLLGVLDDRGRKFQFHMVRCLQVQ